MNAIRCPKCKYHEDSHRAPLGKIVRNPYAAKGTSPVYDDCNACEGTGYIPTKVIDSVLRFASRSDKPEERAAEIFAQLRWSGDHYSFVTHGMYVGIEVDGHMHT